MPSKLNWKNFAILGLFGASLSGCIRLPGPDMSAADADGPTSEEIKSWKKITRARELISSGSSSSRNLSSTLVVEKDGSYELELSNSRQRSGKLREDELQRINDAIEQVASMSFGAFDNNCEDQDHFSEDPKFSTTLKFELEDGYKETLINEKTTSEKFCARGDLKSAARLDAVLEGLVSARRR